MLQQKTLEAFIRWISASPESYHYYDMQRFYELARTAAEQNDLKELMNLSWEPFLDEHQTLWDKKFKLKFEIEWKQTISLLAEYNEQLAS